MNTSPPAGPGSFELQRRLIYTSEKPPDFQTAAGAPDDALLFPKDKPPSPEGDDGLTVQRTDVGGGWPRQRVPLA